MLACGRLRALTKPHEALAAQLPPADEQGAQGGGGAEDEGSRAHDRKLADDSPAGGRWRAFTTASAAAGRARGARLSGRLGERALVVQLERRGAHRAVLRDADEQHLRAQLRAIVRRGQGHVRAASLARGGRCDGERARRGVELEARAGHHLLVRREHVRHGRGLGGVVGDALYGREAEAQPHAAAEARGATASPGGPRLDAQLALDRRPRAARACPAHRAYARAEHNVAGAVSAALHVRTATRRLGGGDRRGGRGGGGGDDGEAAGGGEPHQLGLRRRVGVRGGEDKVARRRHHSSVRERVRAGSHPARPPAHKRRGYVALKGRRAAAPAAPPAEPARARHSALPRRCRLLAVHRWVERLEAGGRAILEDQPLRPVGGGHRDGHLHERAAHERTAERAATAHPPKHALHEEPAVARGLVRLRPRRELELDGHAQAAGPARQKEEQAALRGAGRLLLWPRHVGDARDRGRGVCREGGERLPRQRDARGAAASHRVDKSGAQQRARAAQRLEAQVRRGRAGGHVVGAQRDQPQRARRAVAAPAAVPPAAAAAARAVAAGHDHCKARHQLDRHESAGRCRRSERAQRKRLRGGGRGCHGARRSDVGRAAAHAQRADEPPQRASGRLVYCSGRGGAERGRGRRWAQRGNHEERVRFGVALWTSQRVEQRRAREQRAHARVHGSGHAARQLGSVSSAASGPPA
ncbi:hypothetical protein T492DRAFT_265909 [Pavlovales sp. CCMP2436]|nr:hypothetical protein T492DRAFT_265909 [Pavlovales sp. CCMP2436]